MRYVPRQASKQGHLPTYLLGNRDKTRLPPFLEDLLPGGNQELPLLWPTLSRLEL
jgi:hypothetical protein